MGLQAGNEVWDGPDQPNESRVHSLVQYVRAQRAQSLLRLPVSFSDVTSCAVAQLDVFVSLDFLFDLAGTTGCDIALWQLGRRLMPWPDADVGMRFGTGA